MNTGNTQDTSKLRKIYESVSKFIIKEFPIISDIAEDKGRIPYKWVFISSVAFHGIFLLIKHLQLPPYLTMPVYAVGIACILLFYLLSMLKIYNFVNAADRTDEEWEDNKMAIVMIVCVIVVSTLALAHHFNLFKLLSFKNILVKVFMGCLF